MGKNTSLQDMSAALQLVGSACCVLESVRLKKHLTGRCMFSTGEDLELQGTDESRCFNI